MTNVLNSVSAVEIKVIILRDGRWRVNFDNTEGSEFFSKTVDGKVKSNGTPLKVLPWIFS